MIPIPPRVGGWFRDISGIPGECLNQLRCASIVMFWAQSGSKYWEALTVRLSSATGTEALANMGALQGHRWFLETSSGCIVLWVNEISEKREKRAHERSNYGYQTWRGSGCPIREVTDQDSVVRREGN